MQITMASTVFGDSMLIQQFRFFYREVIALKQVALQSPALALAEDGVHDMRDRPAANLVGGRLATLLEQQQRMALQFGGDFMLAHEEARYVMVALADEIFLNIEWEGKHAWNFNLLEERFYTSHVAGEVFFGRCDALIVAMRDALKVELAKIYLMALCLGFQGKYRGADSQGDLLRYRQSLYQYIFQGSHHLQDDPKPLFPGTEEHTVSGGEMKLMPPIYTWVVRLLAVVAIALVVQHLVWHYLLTPELWELINQIIAAEPAGQAR